MKRLEILTKNPNEEFFALILNLSQSHYEIFFVRSYVIL